MFCVGVSQARGRKGESKGPWVAMRYAISMSFSGIPFEVSIIPSRMVLNSSNPLAGIMTRFRRPPSPSSEIRRNRPRGFSLSAQIIVFRSICICSDLSVSSATGGLGRLRGLRPHGDCRSFEIIFPFLNFPAEPCSGEGSTSPRFYIEPGRMQEGVIHREHIGCSPHIEARIVGHVTLPSG